MMFAIYFSKVQQKNVFMYIYREQNDQMAFVKAW